MKNRSEAFGLAVVGQATKQLQVGASLTYINDVNKYGVAASGGVGGNAQVGFTSTAPSAANLAQVAVGLPDVVFRKAL